MGLPVFHLIYRVAVKIERPLKRKSKTAITQLQNEYIVLSHLNKFGIHSLNHDIND